MESSSLVSRLSGQQHTITYPLFSSLSIINHTQRSSRRSTAPMVMQQNNIFSRLQIFQEHALPTSHEASAHQVYKLNALLTWHPHSRASANRLVRRSSR